MKRYSKPIHLPKPVAGLKRDSSLALINVVFLLLVFLLVSGTLRPTLPEGFEWAETSSDNGAGSSQGSFVLDREGQMWFDGKQLTGSDLETLLPELTGSAGRLIVQVDKRADMAAIAGLADRLKAAGLSKLTLITVEAGQP